MLNNLYPYESNAFAELCGSNTIVFVLHSLHDKTGHIRSATLHASKIYSWSRFKKMKRIEFLINLPFASTWRKQSYVEYDVTYYVSWRCYISAYLRAAVLAYAFIGNTATILNGFLNSFGACYYYCTISFFSTFFNCGFLIFFFNLVSVFFLFYLFDSPLKDLFF